MTAATIRSVIAAITAADKLNSKYSGSADERAERHYRINSLLVRARMDLEDYADELELEQELEGVA